MLMNKEQMFAEYYGLIMYLAKSYHKKTLPSLKRVLDIDDLFMEGVIGAIKAINTFNEDKGSFTAWLNLKARGQMLDTIIKSSGIPKREWKSIRKLAQARERLLQTLDREPSDAELAEQIKVPIEKIQKIKFWIRYPENVDDISNSDKRNRSDEHLILKKLVKDIDHCIQTSLSAEEGFVLIQRIIDGRKLREIGKIINKSLSTVSKIEKKSRQKIMICLENKQWQKQDWIDILQ